jgi:Holliday junction resolvase RusA-like endonuclease
LITITLPRPPSINALWRSGRRRVHRSPEYTSWLELAALHLAIQRPAKISGHYKLHVDVERPRRRDLDNVGFKAVSDLLVRHGIVKDDSLATEISAR